MTEKVPDLIAGRYEVVSQIGSGGFSVVYKAYDRSLQKDVAIKMLLHTEQIDAEQIRRFQQEAKIASGLHHSNLIRVLDCGVTKKNDPFLVMDYVEGTSLCDYIETNGPLPVKKAVRIFVQICEGMQQAHEQGILHRDLKTSNVMLVDAQSSCPRAIILDFGLAKLAKEGHHATLTRPGRSIGTPFYMSPEHARGTTLDNRSDIYSLGCIMYETLTGHPPFTCETLVETVMLQINVQAPSLSEGLPDADFPPELERIVARSLAKSPEDRYQSMDDLRCDLLPMAEGISRDTMTLNPVPAVPESVVQKARPMPALPPWLGRALLGLFSLALLSGGVVAVLRMLSLDTETGQHHQVVRPPSSLDDPLMVEDWNPWPWNEGLTWYKKFGVDDDTIKQESDKIAKFDYVSVWKEPVTDIGIAYLQRMPLKGLYLRESSIDDQALPMLGRMKTLEALYIDKLPQLHQSYLRYLTGLSKMRVLCIAEDEFDDEALRYVGELRSLEVLDIDQNQISGDGLDNLKNLQHLRKLRMGENPFLAKNAVYLANFKALKELYIRRTHMNDASVIYLLALPLESLDISETDIRLAGFSKLRQIKTLRRVYIGNEDSQLAKAVRRSGERYPFEIIFGHFTEDSISQSPSRKRKDKHLPPSTS